MLVNTSLNFIMSLTSKFFSYFARIVIWKKSSINTYVNDLQSYEPFLTTCLQICHFYYYYYNYEYIFHEHWGRSGPDCMVVGFTITCAIIVYHHWSCEFKPRSWRGVLDTTLCDKVCQWLATGRWFSLLSEGYFRHALCALY